MAVVEAYFDNSGDHRSPVFSIAAVIATQEEWSALSLDWNQVLLNFGIEGAFHMTDYNARKKQFGKFKRNDQGHRALMTCLAQAVHNHQVFVVADAVLSADIVVAEDLRNHSQVRDFKDPHSLALIGNLKHIAEVHRRGGLLPPGKIACFMDDDEKRKGRNERIVGHAISRNSEVFSGDYSTSTRRRVPIQIADVMAYEVMRRVRNSEVEDDKLPDRKSLTAMLNATGHEIHSMKKGAAVPLLNDFADYIRRVDPDDYYGR